MATKARMHWFWRGAIAALFGGACLAALDYLEWATWVWTPRPVHMLMELLENVLPVEAARALVFTLVGSLPSAGVVVVYAITSRWFGKPCEQSSGGWREDLRIVRARLNWFWRRVTAIGAGLATFVCIAALLTGGFTRPLPMYLHALLRQAQVRRPPFLADFIDVAVTLVLPALLAAIVVQGVLARHGQIPDGELHCRRCHHILRGLSEPRCPECGEAI